MIGVGIGVKGKKLSAGRGAVQNYGTIVSSNFGSGWFDGNWTETVSNATFTESGNDVIIVNDGTNNFGQYAVYDDYHTCLEYWSMTIPFKATQVTGTGFAVGLKSSNTGAANHHALQFNPGTGKIAFYMAGATSATSTSSGTMTFSLNDEMEMIIARTDLNTMTGTLYNLTTDPTRAAGITLSYTFSQTYPVTVGSPPTSQFVIFPLNGTFTLHSISFTSTEQKYGQGYFVGDSMTRGLYSVNSYDRFASMVASMSDGVFGVGGGPGDRTTSVINRLPEIIALNPYYVYLMIGGNDLEAGVAISTVQTNYASIVTEIKAAGIGVVHLKPTPRDAYDFTTWNAWLDSTYTTDTVIDTWTPLANGVLLNNTFDAGDDLHINQFGHALVAYKILSGVSVAQLGTINYHADADSYFSLVPTTISDSEKIMFHLFFKGMANDSQTASIMRRIWCYAQETEGNTAYSLYNHAAIHTLHDAPTWTQNQGYLGDGTADYIDSKYNASTDASVGQNNLGVFVYSRTDKTAVFDVEIGCYDGTNGIYLDIEDSSGNFYSAISNATVGGTGNTDSRGLFMAIRSAATTIINYKNGVSHNTGNSASAGVPNLNNWVLGRNFNGALNAASPIEAAFAGFTTSAADALKLYIRIQNFMIMKNKHV